jgi:hypothetical protein
MIDYGRVRKGDVLEIVGLGAPGFAAVGDRVEIVHVGLDDVVVEDSAGRWAKFVGTQGASRLLAAEADAVNSSVQPCEHPVLRARIPDGISLTGVVAKLN